MLGTRTVIARAPKLGKDPSTLRCRRDRRGQPTGKALPELAAAGGIYGSRIDLRAGADR